MTDSQEDREFEAFLAGDSGPEWVDRCVAAGSEEPPPEVDARILAAARDAAKVQRLKFGPRGGWLKPVALAATVVLSFSVVLNLVIDAPVPDVPVVMKLKESRVVDDVAQAEAYADSYAAKSLRSSAPQPESAAPLAIEEITVATRSRSTERQEALMSLSALPQEGEGIDQGAALLIVAEYVAAIEMATGAGRILEQKTEKRAGGVTQQAYQPLAGLVVADGDSGSVDEPSGEADPESLLHEIQRLHAAGSGALAGTRLDDFLVRYPDHPLSIKLHEQGY